MIESMIITLREGIEIALVLGILVVYLRKTGRTALLPPVYAGLVLALVGSAGGAVIIQKLTLDQESLEGAFLLAAALFVISMITWMWITSKKINRAIEEKVDALAGSTVTWRSRAGVGLFTFFMIFREGLETAVFLQAVAFSTGGWVSALGTVVGISLATLFAILFIRGSVRIDVGRFLKVTAVTLLLFAVQLILNAVHEFYEYGVLPPDPRMMGILGPIVQHDVLFILAIITIPAIMLLIPGRKRTALSGGRRWQLAAGSAALILVFLMGAGEIFSSSSGMDLSSESIAVPASGIIEIPLASISDGGLHRFAISDSGLEIRFFALRTGVGTIATAFDACRACYSYGRYYLKGGELICSQCDAPVPLGKLHPALAEDHVDENNTGSMEGNGCAPIYLPSRIGSGMLRIALSDLRSQRKYFMIGEVSN